MVDICKFRSLSAPCLLLVGIQIRPLLCRVCDRGFGSSDVRALRGMLGFLGLENVHRQLCHWWFFYTPDLWTVRITVATEHGRYQVVHTSRFVLELVLFSHE
jgi:hypothetical protein